MRPAPVEPTPMQPAPMQPGPADDARDDARVFAAAFGAVLAATLVLPPTARSQGPVAVSQGPLMGVPHALSVDGGTTGPGGPIDATEVRFKADGFASGAPVGWPGGGSLPIWTMAAILQGTSPRPDVDAFSIGFDWVVTDGTGVAVVQAGSWFGITFSVTRGSVGVAGGAIRGESGAPDGAAADVFNYNMAGSALPAAFVDRTLRAQDSTETNVFAPGVPGDIDAHDVFVSLVYGQNPQLLPLVPTVLTNPQRVFFSVTDATRHLIPTAWWQGTTPSGATVFCAIWNGASWDTPVPFLLPGELGLADSEEIDALAIDVVHNEMLFSTATPARDPLMWATGFDGHPGPITVGPFRAPNGGSVSGRIGLILSDNIDSACGLDPGSDPVLRLALGTPIQLPFPTPQPPLQASAFRARVGNNEFFHSYMAGWPPAAGPGPGFAASYIGILQPGPWFLLPVFPSQNRTWPNPPFQGDPRTTQIGIPQNVSTIGAPIYFWWAVADQGLTDLNFCSPVSIRT